MSSINFGELKPKAFEAEFIGRNSEYLITNSMGSVTLVYGNNPKAKKHQAIAFKDCNAAIKIANEIITLANLLKKIDAYQAEMERKNSPTCLYSVPWVGSCGKTSVVNETIGLCEEHSKTTCTFCKKQAIQGCPNAGQFVCGSPLCGECKCKH